MRRLEEIANSKVRIEVQRLHERFVEDVHALMNRNSAKGNLRSGATLKEYLRLCTAAYEQQRDLISREYGWVIDEVVWASTSLPDRMASMCVGHFQQSQQVFETHLRKLVGIVGKPELFDRLCPEINTTRERVLVEVHGLLEGKASVRRNRAIRGLPVSLFSSLAKLFRLSKAS